MKYYVIATKWDKKREKQIKYIAGEFDDFMNAALFKRAYNEHYDTDAEIYEDYELLNQMLSV